MQTSGTSQQQIRLAYRRKETTHIMAKTAAPARHCTAALLGTVGAACDRT